MPNPFTCVWSQVLIIILISYFFSLYFIIFLEVSYLSEEFLLGHFLLLMYNLSTWVVVNSYLWFWAIFSLYSEGNVSVYRLGWWRSMSRCYLGWMSNLVKLVVALVTRIYGTITIILYRLIVNQLDILNCSQKWVNTDHNIMN